LRRDLLIGYIPRWIVIAAVLLFLCGTAPAQRSGPPRFLYELSCNTVVKVDLTNGQTIEEILLSNRTKLVPAESPRTAFCDLDAMMYSPADRQAQTIVSDRVRRTYTWIAFSVPEFRVVASRPLPEAFEEDASPRFVRGRSGAVLVDFTRGYMKLTAGAAIPAEADGRAGVGGVDHSIHLAGLQTGSHEGWLDLAQYHGEGLLPYSAYGQGKLLLSKPLMQAAGEVVLRVSGANGDRLAAVDVSSRKITVFDIPPGKLTMTSDGHYLIVQEAGKPGGTPYGRAWFVDMAAEKILKVWNDHRVNTSAFLAFAPTGELVFQGFAESTGLTFAVTEPVNGFFSEE
jgi:hypothetical protein